MKAIKKALHVLPPSKPRYSEGVEKSVRISEEEFHSGKDSPANGLAEFRVDHLSIGRRK
ncbi:MAG: hypothetical protein LBB24_00095 [Rickettsiales bacterium]|jgi:hypothetical protein|nr:hypothetical protein [Rickettsiales bacterium]